MHYSKPRRFALLLSLSLAATLPACGEERLSSIDEAGGRIEPGPVEPACDVRAQLLSELDVLPDGQRYSTSSLEPADYVIVARGTYVYRPNTDAGLADAAFSLRLVGEHGVNYESAPYAPWVRSNDLPVTGVLGLWVQGMPFDWGDDLRSDHVYAAACTHGGGPIAFSIVDDAYADNSGSLHVEVFPANACGLPVQ